MSKKIPITLADVRYLFRLRDELRWTYLRQWILQELKPVGGAILLWLLVYSLGIGFGAGVSTGWDANVNLRIVVDE